MHLSAERVLEINQDFHEEFGLEALRPEAKILLTLKSRPSLSVKEAIILSGLSYRGFYIVLARLVDSGTIVMRGDSNDKRVKRIHLAEGGFGDYLPPARNAIRLPLK